MTDKEYPIPDWWDEYLAAIADGATSAQAAKTADVSPYEVTKLKRKNEDAKQMYKDARELAREEKIYAAIEELNDSIENVRSMRGSTDAAVVIRLEPALHNAVEKRAKLLEQMYPTDPVEAGGGPDSRPRKLIYDIKRNAPVESVEEDPS